MPQIHASTSAESDDFVAATSIIILLRPRTDRIHRVGCSDHHCDPRPCPQPDTAPRPPKLPLHHRR